MNLAFLTKRYDTVGGTERDLYELTRRFVALGHEIHVYCLDTRVNPLDGIHLHRIPVPGPGRTFRLWSLAARGPAAAYRGHHDLVISYAKVLRQDIVRCGGGTHQLFLSLMSECEHPAKHFFRRIDPYHRSLLSVERRQC